MKTSQVVILLLVGGVAVGAAMYFNGGRSDGTGRTVAYSSVGDSNSWFIAFSAELKKEAEKRGYNFSVTHAQSDAARQIDDVEDIVAQKPDYLILGPKKVKASAPALAIAKKAGIPVIVVNRDIVGEPGVDYVTKIYSDFEWIGEKMAEAVHDAFGPEKKLIRIVELHGTSGGGNTIGMSKGLRNGIEKYGNMKVVRSQPGNFDRITAMKAMENILQSGVEFDAIVCHFDTEAMGAIQALRTAKRKMGNDPTKGEIIIVGNGGTIDGLKAVKEGYYHKIISVTPYYANQVFDAIEAHAKGEEVAPYIRVEDIVIDKSNVDEHMATGF
jgi:ABC-type sugar transport system substrate-binding protein